MWCGTPVGSLEDLRSGPGGTGVFEGSTRLHVGLDSPG